MLRDLMRYPMSHKKDAMISDTILLKILIPSFGAHRSARPISIRANDNIIVQLFVSMKLSILLFTFTSCSN